MNLRLRTCLIVVALTVASGGLLTEAQARTASKADKGPAAPNVVLVWNQTLIAALAAAGTPAPVGPRLAAIVQASVFDAVNGIERRYTPIHVAPAAPRGASRAAAAVAAAHEALLALFPTQQAMLDAQLASSLATIGGDSEDGGKSIARGLAWGKTVADQIVAWRAGDHFSDPVPVYVPGTDPGDWQPTPPGFSTQPLFRQLAVTTPFAMTSPSQFRPPAPPALTSARYATDFNEVKAIGNAPTPEQSATAVFWAADTVGAIWNRAADRIAEARNLSLSRSSLLLARLNVAMADAETAIWEAKNHYDTWRPVTAIAQAASDGNPGTIAQTGWTPLLVTPVFQEYPSGHSGTSSAAATILASVFGNATTFVVTSAGVPGVERTFATFSSASDQVNDARVFGGIHFRFACEAAAQVGANVANYVDQTMFLRVHGREDDDDD